MFVVGFNIEGQEEYGADLQVEDFTLYSLLLSFKMASGGVVNSQKSHGGLHSATLLCFSSRIQRFKEFPTVSVSALPHGQL